MLCPFCGNSVNPTLRTIERRRKGVSISFCNVPVETCDCGEIFVDEKIIKILNYILKQKETDLSKRDYFVLDYNQEKENMGNINLSYAAG